MIKKDVPFTTSASRRDQRGAMRVDLASLRAIDHFCHGCGKDEKCCCATYEVCVTTKEMNRIIGLLPELVKLCSHLGTDGGFDNLFDEVEPGLFALDTNEEGRCLFSYVSKAKLRCSLHTVGSRLGLPLDQVKPKACLLWPMTFSEGQEVLSLIDDALLFPCNVRKGRRSRSLCSSFIEAITMVYGEVAAALVKAEAAKGARNLVVPTR